MGVKIRERRPGEWWIYIDFRGKRKALKVGRSEKAAVKAAADLEQKLSTGKLILDPPEGPPRVLLREYAKTWMEGHVRHSRKAATARTYQQVLDAYILPALGARVLFEIKREEVRELCYGTLQKGLSAQTVKLITTVLSSMFNHAKEDGLMTGNPAERPGRYLRVPDRRGKAEFLAPEESRALLKAARAHAPRFYPVVLMALRTGMRQGEILALEWGDVDFHGKFIEVRRSNWKGQVSTPKSGKSRRVDMSDRLKAVLEEHRKRAAAEALKAGRSMPALVFTNWEGEATDGWTLRKQLAKCLTRAKLRHVPFHALRHTFASALLGLGESPAYVKEQMGHHSIQLTVDTYGHLIPGANRQAVNRLDEMDRNPQPRRNQGVKGKKFPEKIASLAH